MAKEKKVVLSDEEFENEVRRFGTRVDFIVAMEMGHKIDAQKAYDMIKREYKIFKAHIKGKGA